MKNKQVIIFVMAILVIAVGNYFSFQIALNNAIDLVEVPFAAEEIYPHYEVSEEAIEWREIPRAYVDHEVLITKEDIVGKYVSLDSKIAKGSLFYKDYLIEKSEIDTLPALLLKEDQVAFPLSLNLLKSSGNTISQNQKVDVYVSYTDKKTKESIIDILLMNVRVIGVKDKNGYDMRDEKAAKLPSILILAIDKEYINLIQLANEVGEISILAPRINYAEDEESILYKESKILPILNYDDI